MPVVELYVAKSKFAPFVTVALGRRPFPEFPVGVRAGIVVKRIRFEVVPRLPVKFNVAPVPDASEANVNVLTNVLLPSMLIVDVPPSVPSVRMPMVSLEAVVGLTI